MRVSPQAIVSPLPAKEDGVPRMLRSATSVFTRVFNALWRCAADPGPFSSTWFPALRRSVKNAAPRPGHELCFVKR